jgi:hypothetical protein
VYDPQNDSWASAPGIPTPRSGLTAAVIDGKIYVAGGYILSGGVVRQDVLQVYDPTTQTWSTLSDMPEARTGIAAASVRGRMYVFGGEPASSVSKALEYDPTSDFWSELQDMPSAGSFAGVAAFKDTIYVVGGGPVNLNRFDGQSINRAFLPPSAVTSVSRDEFLPNGFELRQNYPNPFNPSTTISFTLDVKQHVTLQVYNLLGRVRSTLVDAVQPAGEHRVVWDARDSKGLGVANGLYVYRISTNGRSQSRKMLLLK